MSFDFARTYSRPATRQQPCSSVKRPLCPGMPACLPHCMRPSVPCWSRKTLSIKRLYWCGMRKCLCRRMLTVLLISKQISPERGNLGSRRMSYWGAISRAWGPTVPLFGL